MKEQKKREPQKPQPKNNKEEKPLYPMRINKYLALMGYTTRRGADNLIQKKQVSINGRLAVLGDKVTPSDRVELKNSAKKQEYVYLAYNKPIGVITHSPQVGEKDIRQSIKLTDVFPLGRLDKDSSGLIILTNDGRITDKLLNPKYEHEKEYVVKVNDPLRGNFKEKIEGGLNIEGYLTKKCKVKQLGEKSFKITLTEGKKHQVRRMVVALFNIVKELKRTRIMNIELGQLHPGAWRKIEGEELNKFLGELGV